MLRFSEAISIRHAMHVQLIRDVDVFGTAAHGKARNHCACRLWDDKLRPALAGDIGFAGGHITTTSTEPSEEFSKNSADTAADLAEDAAQPAEESTARR